MELEREGTPPFPSSSRCTEVDWQTHGGIKEAEAEKKLSKAIKEGMKPGRSGVSWVPGKPNKRELNIAKARLQHL